jgi:hypothetical protein
MFAMVAGSMVLVVVIGIGLGEEAIGGQRLAIGVVNKGGRRKRAEPGR